MPKDEFDFDDPMELSGVALATEEDTTDAMCECFIEEFMRLGYNAKQILALFRNPHYIGMNMVMQNRGEQFVRDYIVEVFARWGKSVTWSDITPRPLTPALSPSEGERENRSPSHREAVADAGTRASEISETGSSLFPLPLGGGGGQGEGEGVRSFAIPASEQKIELDASVTDPMGAAVPKLNA